MKNSESENGKNNKKKLQIAGTVEEGIEKQRHRPFADATSSDPAKHLFQKFGPGRNGVNPIQNRVESIDIRYGDELLQDIRRWIPVLFDP